MEVVWDVLMLRPYFEGRRFMIRTDHDALTLLLNMEYATGKLERWKKRCYYQKFIDGGIHDCLRRQTAIEKIVGIIGEHGICGVHFDIVPTRKYQASPRAAARTHLRFIITGHVPMFIYKPYLVERPAQKTLIYDRRRYFEKIVC